MGNDIGNTTGIAKEQGELYYLSDEQNYQKILSYALQSKLESHSSSSQI